MLEESVISRLRHTPHLAEQDKSKHLQGGEGGMHVCVGGWGAEETEPLPSNRASCDWLKQESGEVFGEVVTGVCVWGGVMEVEIFRGLIGQLNERVRRESRRGGGEEMR